MNRIILSIIFVIGVLINLYNFTDVFGETAIPKFRPFGTSTMMTDSTNYVNLLGKGLNVPNDSVKVGKYLFVGTKGGGIYLDTNRMGEMLYSGTSFRIINNKENGSMEFYVGEKSSEYYWYKSTGGTGTQLMQLDSINGLTLSGHNFQTSSTGQVKLPSDTVSDYDANDAVTLNRQSGTITTKTLTTAAGVIYAFTFTNSLISSSSVVFAMIKSSSFGTPIVIQCSTSAGSVVIFVMNIHASQALNSALGISFIVFN